ncbi:MAG: hypothetical protein HQM09_01920 [Candidatus Riflebacteria bacterium]|nr:hypothetical protein [Candidatus Riflebacteria bacterium]
MGAERRQQASVSEAQKSAKLSIFLVIDEPQTAEVLHVLVMNKRIIAWTVAFSVITVLHSVPARRMIGCDVDRGTVSADSSDYSGRNGFSPDQDVDAPDAFRGEVPVPPLKGRSGERSALGHLLAPARTYAHWLAAGKAYLARREYEQAIWAFRKALRERPLAQESHFLLGCAYVARGAEGLPGDMTGWDELAETSFLAAINLADHLPARYNLGILLTRRDRPAEARVQFEHILNISPKSRLGSLARRALERNIDADLLPRSLAIELPDLPAEKRAGSTDLRESVHSAPSEGVSESGVGGYYTGGCP